MEKDVETELAEIEAIALRVVRREAANVKDREEIKNRLPALRKRNVGPAELEQRIHRVFAAGTISRWTKDVAGPDGSAKTTPGRAKRDS